MAEDNAIVRHIYSGEDREDVPLEATHITTRNIKIVPHCAFRDHPNIVEAICDNDVDTIDAYAFSRCPSLRRVIMLGVKIVEECAFVNCPILTDVEFGNELESIEEAAFDGCTSLERITIPLKDDLIHPTNIFQGCVNLKHVDLIAGELHETISALQLEHWRNDLIEQIDVINQVLPNTGRKDAAIEWWIRSILGKIIYYKAEHRRLLGEATTTLQHALPQEIVMNNVISFLALPAYKFEGEGNNEQRRSNLAFYSFDEYARLYLPERHGVKRTSDAMLNITLN